MSTLHVQYCSIREKTSVRHVAQNALREPQFRYRDIRCAPMTTRAVKITFGQLREQGLRHIEVFCRDYTCSHSVILPPTVGRIMCGCRTSRIGLSAPCAASGGRKLGDDSAAGYIVICNRHFQATHREFWICSTPATGLALHPHPLPNCLPQPCLLAVEPAAVSCRCIC